MPKFIRDFFSSDLIQTLVLYAGNDNLHLLTSERRQQLRVDLADFAGNSRFAKYDDFAVGSAWSKYILISLGTYNGNAGPVSYTHLTLPTNREV